MFFKKDYKTVNVTPEILAADKFVSFTGMLLQTDVAADNEGKRVCEAGHLIDADGHLVVVEEGALSGTPAGILLDTVDCTYGNIEVPLLVEGYVYGDRLKLGDEVETTAENLALVTEALPEIKLR